MFVVDRNTARPYLSVRYCKSNTFGTWRKWRPVMPMLQALFEGGTQLASTRATSTATGGGQIYLNGGGGNRIEFANQGVNPPAFNTRSNGTRMCLWSSLDASNTDYAIGIEVGSMWFSVLASGQGFSWYAGTTRFARLNGSGAFFT